MVTHIVIPVRNQLEFTKSVTQQLKSMPGWEKCFIFDNGSVDDTPSFLEQLSSDFPRFIPINAEGKTIYEMWDWGFNLAEGADHVLFLNNDLEMHPQTIVHLNKALASNDNVWISYPDYSIKVTYPGFAGDLTNYKITRGTFRHGGMSGFCFMLKKSKINWSPLVDPQFIWWGGDDDIAFEVEKRGGQQVRVLSLPLTHLIEGTARHHDLGAQKAKDLKAVIRKWGR